MFSRFMDKFNEDLEVILAKYSQSFDGDEEILLSTYDQPCDKRRTVAKAKFSKKSGPECSNSSIEDSSAPFDCSTSSNEYADLLSYHNDEENGRIFITPTRVEEEDSTSSSSYESDCSGIIKQTDKKHKVLKKRSTRKPKNGSPDERGVQKSIISPCKSLFPLENKLHNILENSPTRAAEATYDSNLLVAMSEFRRLFLASIPGSTSLTQLHDSSNELLEGLRSASKNKMAILPPAGTVERKTYNLRKKIRAKRQLGKSQPKYVVEKVFVRAKDSQPGNIIEVASRTIQNSEHGGVCSEKRCMLLPTKNTTLQSENIPNFALPPTHHSTPIKNPCQQMLQLTGNKTKGLDHRRSSHSILTEVQCSSGTKLSDPVYSSPVPMKKDPQKSLKVKTTPRRNSCSFRPYKTRQEKSPSLSSPFHALSIHSPRTRQATRNDQTLRRTRSGPTTPTEPTFTFLEKKCLTKHGKITDVTTEECPQTPCSKKFCFDCTMNYD